MAAPWHILAGIRNRGFFWFYFVNEHFLRFLGKRYPMDYNKLPALAYWGLQLVWLFPWSLYVPLALLKGWIHAVASVNPLTAVIQAERSLIAGQPEHVALAFAAAAALVLAFLFWAVRGLRRAEAAGS